jgi:methylthioribose-1-phosphate isomerase
VKDLNSLALKVEGGKLTILDQTRLPDAEIWLDGSDPVAMVGHIQRLSVRGAPLIGVAAALGLAAFAESGADRARLAVAAAALRAARPTAVNLMWAMDRMSEVMAQGGACSDLVREAEAIFEEDVQLCEAMAEQALPLFTTGEAVLTHCNSGGLATAGIGTALGAIRRAWEAGKVHHVYADETRPLLQGGRLTAWELTRLGIPFTLLTDSMAALLLRDGQVQRALVGADRIARNGDFANKVGTYGLAVNARHHGVPFHAVAPFSTVDLSCPQGAAIPIEDRAAEEVRGFGSLRWAPEGAPVFNPAFDVTPADLLTSLVTDRGVYAPAALALGALGAEDQPPRAR